MCTPAPGVPARAALADPRIAADPDAWRLAVASLLGRRLVGRIRGGVSS
jgi:hypothetical protein